MHQNALAKWTQGRGKRLPKQPQCNTKKAQNSKTRPPSERRKAASIPKKRKNDPKTALKSKMHDVAPKYTYQVDPGRREMAAKKPKCDPEHT